MSPTFKVSSNSFFFAALSCCKTAFSENIALFLRLFNSKILKVIFMPTKPSLAFSFLGPNNSLAGPTNCDKGIKP